MMRWLFLFAALLFRCPASAEIVTLFREGGWAVICANPIKDMSGCSAVAAINDSTGKNPVGVAFTSNPEGDHLRMFITTFPIYGEKQVQILLNSVNSGGVRTDHCSAQDCQFDFEIPEDNLARLIAGESLGIVIQTGQKTGKLATFDTNSLHKVLSQMIDHLNQKTKPEKP